MMVIRVVVIMAIGIIITAFICIFLRMKKKQLAHTNNNESDALDLGMDESLIYNYHLVKLSTNEFSNDARLGEGGFGDVYKGKLEDGTNIAVKRLASNSEQGDLQFKNEISLLAKLQHRNLVRLLGYSIEGTERLLIYEFVPHGSLDKFIYDSSNREILDWEKRYKILIGVARGLLYLHEDSRQRIIHRDMKASNILLDDELNPKIADFALSKLFQPGETNGRTQQSVGTYGYMAPEYAKYGEFSIKSDVYSYGVLVLELMAGRKTLRYQDEECVENLPELAWNNWRNNTITELIDPILKRGSGTLEDIMRIIQIGLLCVQYNHDQRPTMSWVVQTVSNSSLTLADPSGPGLPIPDNHPNPVTISVIMRCNTTELQIPGNDASTS